MMIINSSANNSNNFAAFKAGKFTNNLSKNFCKIVDITQNIFKDKLIVSSTEERVREKILNTEELFLANNWGVVWLRQFLQTLNLFILTWQS